MSACPTCGKPVDPLRARAVAVIDGKVVGFCSAGCAAEAGAKQSVSSAAEAVQRVETGPVVAVHSGKVRAPMLSLDSEPVIEIVRETSSGVVTSARDERKSAPVAVQKPLTDTLDDDEEEPLPKRTSDEPAGVKSSEGKDTAEVSGERDTPDPTRKKRQNKRDSMNAKAAWEWLDEEPAEPVDPRGSRYGRRTGRNILLVLLVLAAAGGGYAYYEYVYRPHKAGTEVSRAPKASGDLPDMPEPVDQQPHAAPAPPPLTADAALVRARDVLRTSLTTGSPRIQRLAAQALSRTGDPASITTLAAALAEDKTQSRLELAYALARAGDKRGGDALVAALGSGKRDVKLEAGRWLALLGDKRGMPVLESYLEVTQLRLGVAEQLAYVADPKALEVLEQIRKDAKATPDEKARATIALGNAGKTEVADELHALLDDPRQNSFAATALAGLHDAAARPVLEKQLDVPSLRVAAARGLRQLAPDLDATAWLPKLVESLAAGKDTEQIQAAETILLIAGPPAWSEHA